MAEEEAVRAFLDLQVDGRVSGAAAVSWVAGHPRFAALSRPAREVISFESYRYLKNAFYVYSSWFQRETKKPGCKIPETLLKYPSVFQEQNFCTQNPSTSR